MEPRTLAHVLADATSPEPAVVADAGAVTISYRDLDDQVERLAETLRRTDLRPGAAVALVLPNGIEFLVLLLALARAELVAAPLNPAYSAQELRALIVELEAGAVVAGSDAVVREAVAETAIPIWTASISASGVVDLAGVRASAPGGLDAPDADAVAIYLHTSGTEGRPKVVPLTHANVLISAQNIAAHYALTAADRSLAVLPFFHGHGLIGVALSTLASGGAVIVSPRFSASRFWASFHEHRATWYSAVPTIHQILLERADANGAPHMGARFIRSCSAALAPVVLAALERRFGTPVIEAYGITEAGHQVASNPLPPHERKAGTVGPGVGAEIAIVDPGGRHRPRGTSGEVIVRGPAVMHAYRDNRTADAAAFIGGWFRTGDIGALDEDGYLTVSGRMKEMINRGGEKIAPLAIDNVLLAHPAVAEAAAFGVPDPKYGEVVEAVVVLKRDAEVEELRAFCRERLAEFEVPTMIRIVSAIPRNAMGKVERRALATLYPLTS